MNYEPFDFEERPGGAPEHIHNHFDMFREMLDVMLEAHKDLLVHQMLTPIEHVQKTHIAFALSQLDFSEVAALFAVAIDQVVRTRLENDNG